MHVLVEQNFITNSFMPVANTQKNYILHWCANYTVCVISMFQGLEDFKDFKVQELLWDKSPSKVANFLGIPTGVLGGSPKGA